MAWVGMMEDQSGTWSPRRTTGSRSPPRPRAWWRLLKEIGRVYPPVMLANAEAVANGAPEVSAVVDGRPWTQQTFAYQAKCLMWLRESHAALPPSARDTLSGLLGPAGLAPLLG